MCSDVSCPYCGTGQDIDHDDGQGYDESKTHAQECTHCEKTFTFTTSILFFYEAAQAACLNGLGPHKYSPTKTFPVEFTRMRCEDCGHKRQCSDTEISELG